MTSHFKKSQAHPALEFFFHRRVQCQKLSSSDQLLKYRCDASTCQNLMEHQQTKSTSCASPSISLSACPTPSPGDAHELALGDQVAWRLGENLLPEVDCSPLSQKKEAEPNPGIPGCFELGARCGSRTPSRQIPVSARLRRTCPSTAHNYIASWMFQQLSSQMLVKGKTGKPLISFV